MWTSRNLENRNLTRNLKNQRLPNPQNRHNPTRSPKNEDIFDVKVAGNMNKRQLVYDEMFRQAETLAKKGKGVILDATFVTRDLRGRAAEIAAKTKIPFVILRDQLLRKGIH